MSFLKGGKFKPTGVETPATTTTTTEAVKPTATKPSPFGKKKLGGLSKPSTTVKEEPKELDLDHQEEEIKAEEPKAPAVKPKLGGKRLGGGLKKKEETIEEAAEKLAEVQTQDEIPVEVKEETVEEKTETAEEVVEETKEEAPKKTSKKKTTKKKTTTADKENAGTVLTVPEVDESKRISIEEMDAVMRPIVAPTTELWEKEKQDVLTALDNIKVEQDMTMAQVKNALAELDNLKFEVLPKCHDAETLYDGTKKNYETVKALAISRGSASNAEARKAEGILACQNYVTPTGAVVDLNQYMLLIEERNKFYQKIVEGINFKKYSLVNYNTALKIEAKDL